MSLVELFEGLGFMLVSDENNLIIFEDSFRNRITFHKGVKPSFYANFVIFYDLMLLISAQLQVLRDLEVDKNLFS